MSATEREREAKRIMLDRDNAVAKVRADYSERDRVNGHMAREIEAIDAEAMRRLEALD